MDIKDGYLSSSNGIPAKEVKETKEARGLKGIKERTVPAGQFKNSCLKLMEQVHRAGIPLVVTKRGKPLVRIVAVREEPSRVSLLGTIVREADDITSTGEPWEATC